MLKDHDKDRNSVQRIEASNDLLRLFALAKDVLTCGKCKNTTTASASHQEWVLHFENRSKVLN